jgi:hypothetical protein
MMTRLRRLLGLTVPAVAFALALGIGGAAKAALTGTFSVDIYNYNAGGTESNADATEGNVTTYAGSKLGGTFTYTGALDFHTPPLINIDDFLASGGGTLTESNAGDLLLLDTPASASGFTTTTLYVFTWTATQGITNGSILHDDGISLFDDGTLITAASAAEPTTEANTSFLDVAAGSSMKLIYSAANNNPETLKVTGVVPIPGAVWLFGSAMLGLLGVGYRRRAAA